MQLLEVKKSQSDSVNNVEPESLSLQYTRSG